MSKIKSLNSNDKDVHAYLKNLVAWDDQLDANVHGVVKEILTDIKQNGDSALIAYTQKFDGLSVKQASELEIPKERLLAALENLPTDHISELESSAKRVLDYHQKQI